MSIPLQIGKMIVRWDAVEMTSFHPFRAGTDENLQDQAMDVAVHSPTIRIYKSNLDITVTVNTSFQGAPPLDQETTMVTGLDCSVIRNLVTWVIRGFGKSNSCSWYENSSRPSTSNIGSDTACVPRGNASFKK
jgi:hypothetical protein